MTFLKNKRYKKWLKTLGVSSVLTLFVFLFCIYCPWSPEGIYYDPDIACEHGVWILEDGKISICCVGEELPHDSGRYIKSNGRWRDGTGHMILKPSIFGITFYGKSFRNGRQFYIRNQFSWIYNCEDWLGKYF